MSYKTRKLTRAELSAAFRAAWGAARDYRRAGESLQAAFARNLKVYLADQRMRMEMEMRMAAFRAANPITETEIEIIRIEAADRLTKADRARLAELKSLPLAA